MLRTFRRFFLSWSQPVWLCLLVLLCAAGPVLAQSPKPNELTAEERDYLARSGPIVFISQSSYPPFEFVDARDGKLKGMMIELAGWISTEYGFHAEFRDTTFIQAQEAVQRGEADVLTSFFYSEARDRLFDFTDTVFEIPASIFVAVERPDIAHLADLANKRIAIQRGDYAEAFLKGRDIPFELVPTDDFDDATRAVLEGRADALIGDEQIVLHFLYRTGLNTQMKRVGEPLYVGRNAMAVREGNAMLHGILDKGIARARASGALERISEKWSGQVMADPEIDLLEYWPYAVAVAVLLLLGTLSNLHLRHVVRAKTAELVRHQTRLEGIIEGTRAGTWEWLLDNGRIVINELWAQMLGYTRDDLTPLTEETRNRLIHPEDRERAAALLKAHLDGHVAHYACELRMRHRNGSWVWLLERGQITERDATGRPRVVAGTQIDITARKLTEVELQLTASVFANAREGILITDANGNIIDVNPAFVRITGYQRGEAIGKTPRMLKSTHHSAAFFTRFWRDLTTNGFWEGEMWNRRKDGDIYPEILTVSGVRDDKGDVSHFVAVFSDISRQKDYERQLERLAYYDDLTELPNRVLLVDRLSQAIARARRGQTQLGVAYLDLDGFKEINDNCGHDLGDRVLVEVANRLREALREEDTVARVGGDEFVIVLFDAPDNPPQEVVVRRLLESISKPIAIDDQSYQVSGSIGLVRFNGDQDLDSDQLIRQADQAMYQAKQAGKNRFHLFDAEQDRAVRGRHENIARIRRAMLDREFRLHYQPKVNLREGTVFGAEALIRWAHPSRGLLSPATFLPDIENHRVGVELGEWVIDSALAQIGQWRREGLDLIVSVNVGANHLQQADFVDRLQSLLQAHPEVPPQRLELEVLETSALEDVARISSVITACSRLGVRFALDDFGTGYSSLIYLKRLPVQVLKIDQGFVRDMLHDPGDLSILEGVLGLARAFHRDVIAEGVETEEHGKFLLQLGCEQAQGYAIARPMPAEAFLDWARQWRAPDAWMRAGQLRREDIEMLYAASEHRAWVEQLKASVRGGTDTTPETEERACRFGQWLARARSGDNGTASFDVIDRLHQEIHVLSRELVGAHDQGDWASTDRKLTQLQAFSHEMLTLMQELIDARSRRRRLTLVHAAGGGAERSED